MTEDDLSRALARSPYASFLGPRCELRGDALVMVLPYRERLLGNPLTPALHGGAVSAFMELTATAQLFVRVGAERFPKTIGVAVDYHRIGRPRDTYARARITRLGRRVANVRVEAWQDQLDEPIATLHGHFLVRPRAEAAAG